MICPLCHKEEAELYHQDKFRSFFKCSFCELIFVPRESLITPSQEKERYESHENADENDGYRQYLSKIAGSITPNLNLHNTGLDFGSGKTKLLAELLKPYRVESYDLYFHPHDDLLKDKYDFIILSEVIEHLRDPQETMLKLRKLLNPGGKFFIKTMLVPDSREKFENWFYKRDITHVQFFSERSFNELTSILGMKEYKKIGEDLFLFRE